MDPTYRSVCLAADVRRAWELLTRVADRLQDTGRKQLSLDVFDLELKLIELHDELLKLPRQSLAPARREQFYCQEDLPF